MFVSVSDMGSLLWDVLLIQTRVVTLHLKAETAIVACVAFFYYKPSWWVHVRSKLALWSIHTIINNNHNDQTHVPVYKDSITERKNTLLHMQPEGGPTDHRHRYRHPASKFADIPHHEP
jgi:hypothetical protein